MNKHEAVASLGEDVLVRPALVRDALRANDRLKLYLTVLQAAATHAAAPDQPAVDLQREIAAADIRERDEATWLRELPANALRDGRTLLVPNFVRLRQRLASDLGAMARPVVEDVDADPALVTRVEHWRERLQALQPDVLDDGALAELTRGSRDRGDSLHLLVMDLHKALNRLAGRLQGKAIAGASTWQLADDGRDAALVEAFMHGVERTRALKLDHPGLDTCATRDGKRLLIQNDIGTNDAHVLVVQVEDRAIVLTYSDLHRRRFAFFQALLREVGAQWSELASRTTPGLNDGEAYHVGTARFVAADDDELRRQLEAIGSRIVFLIDWNRARKRLAALVGKARAEAVLHEAARREIGHMPWLVAGGERLVWNAMAAQGESVFRLGDRLDAALDANAACECLVEVLALASEAAARGRPADLVADEVRLLLARRLRGRRGGADLLQEHAAWCHALAQGLRDALAHGAERDPGAAEKLAVRAKAWEREADELVIRARARAERQPRWRTTARLLERADDVADALEQAIFVLSLAAEHHKGWSRGVREAMQALADAVLAAVQDHVRAVSINASGDGGAVDQDAALDALWRVVQAERQCDELLRSARRALVREVSDAASLSLGNELAAAMERASDHLLALGHALRLQALQHDGAVA
jgi:uncharacterized protein Yka (UPF0111/DUF47 family)